MSVSSILTIKNPHIQNPINRYKVAEIGLKLKNLRQMFKILKILEIQNTRANPPNEKGGKIKKRKKNTLRNAYLMAE